MSRVRGLSVSSCGDKVWGCQIQRKVNKKYISKLMMYDFKKKSHFLYDYEHQRLITLVLFSEAFKLAMSGGLDRILVLHDLESGKTIKRFKMKYGSVSCLLDLGSAEAVGDEHTVRFFALQTREMDPFEVISGGAVYQLHESDHRAELPDWPHGSTGRGLQVQQNGQDRHPPSHCSLRKGQSRN